MGRIQPLSTAAPSPGTHAHEGMGGGCACDVVLFYLFWVLLVCAPPALATVSADMQDTLQTGHTNGTSLTLEGTQTDGIQTSAFYLAQYIVEKTNEYTHTHTHTHIHTKHLFQFCELYSFIPSKQIPSKQMPVLYIICIIHMLHTSYIAY